ncbi:MAG: YncE family protein [Rhodanobacteraceae bacterium]
MISAELEAKPAKVRCLGWGIAALAIWMVCGASLAAEPSLQLTPRSAIRVDAPVRALAFGSGGARMYIAAGSDLRAYDSASGGLLATLKLPGSVADMTVDKTDSIGFAAVSSPRRLIFFQLHPLRIVRSVTLTDGAPSALLYDAAAHVVFVESAHSGALTEFDAASGRRLAALKLPGTLRQMAVNDRGTLYVANAARNGIDVIDVKQMKYLGAIPLRGCSGPTGLAMDPVGRRLFVSCTDGMRAIVDADMGFTFERLPSLLRGSSRMLFAFHPFGTHGWKGAAISCGANDRLALIKMEAFVKYTAAGDFSLQGHCGAMALDNHTHQLWLAVGSKLAQAPRSNGLSVKLWTLGPAGQTSP